MVGVQLGVSFGSALCPAVLAGVPISFVDLSAACVPVRWVSVGHVLLFSTVCGLMVWLGKFPGDPRRWRGRMLF